MFLIVVLSILFTFALCAGLSVQLWPYRRSTLHRILLITQACYAIWALLVLMVFMTEDFETRIFLTKMRQVTNPLLAPSWIAMALLVFYRGFWEKYKRWMPLLYVIPVLAMIASLASIFHFSFAEKWGFYDFQELANSHRLLSYKSGLFLTANFIYAQICILALYSIYVVSFFKAQGLRRRYSVWFAVAGILHVGIEITGRFILKDPVLVQAGILAIWPVALTLYFAVTQLEFLDIKSLAQQRVFENLPSPVITLTPHQELWDANQSAQKLFALTQSQMGKPVQQISSLIPLMTAEETISIDSKIHQVFRHNVEIKGGEEKASVYVLNDISEISELNTELEESNETLKALNSEILRITEFNRKIQSILSHDLVGSLSGVNSLLIGTRKLAEQKQEPELMTQMDRLSQASSASLALLGDILTWSHEEDQLHSADLRSVLDVALKQLNAQIINKEIEIKTNVPPEEILVFGSKKILESILRNLLSNAIKFSPQQGRVQIEFQVHQPHVDIIITDWGTGMDEGTISKILSGTAQSQDLNEGFGVGMRFTLSFIEKLKGQMSIQSTLGTGSKIQVRLPLLT